MKVIFADQWKIRAVLNNKLCFQSIQHPDEELLISKVKYVNRDTNEAYYYSLSGDEVVRKSRVKVYRRNLGIQACPND